MIIPRFLQIHSLHSYPAALLNRDDSGLAKRMAYGGHVRTRISSQCLKRHWRTAQDEFSLENIPGSKKAIRSRNIISRRVIAPICAEGGSDAERKVLSAVEEEFQKGVYGDKGATESGRQPLLLGLPEVEFLRDQAAAICREHCDNVAAARKATQAFFRGQRNNFKTFREKTRLPGGLVGALFGRMVTSDPAANIDAAIHVAHSFTVHPEESESDYFSVVDDLQGEEEDAGAAHIGDMELTSGIFYGYVVVDIPGLVSNLEGCRADEWENNDRELAGKVVQHLTHLIATVTPGAKLGSTAPYSFADFLLLEVGSRQPRSLAGAFRPIVKAQTDDAVKALEKHLARLDSAYGKREIRRALWVGEHQLADIDVCGLEQLASWAAAVVVDAKAV